MEPKTTSEFPVVEKLTPVGFRVLVNTYKKPTSTLSGLSLPQSENEGISVKAQIVCLGKKTIGQKLAVFFGLKPRYKVGQWVYYRKYSIDELRLQNATEEVTLYCLEENEIVMIVNE